MKKSIKIAIGVIMGCMVINGCMSNSTPKETKPVTQQEQQKIECGYEHGSFGSYTASNPIQLQVGQQFGFGGAMEFDSKRIDAENHKVYGLVIRDDDVALYEIDVNNAPKGWDKLENKQNVYVADDVIRERMLVADLVDAGAYPLKKVDNVNDLGKFVDVTLVKAHIVHVHNEECK